MPRLSLARLGCNLIFDCETYLVNQPLAGKYFGLEGLETLCREAGISKAVVISEIGVQPDNKQLADMLAAHPGCKNLFLPCAWINPNFGEAAVSELETCVCEWGFVALKLMPTHHFVRLVGTVAHALMRKVQGLKIPVTIHSGTFLGHPLEIAVLAKAFPDVPVIMDHMGYRYYVAEAIAAAREAPNIYLATTAVMEPHWIRQAVKEIGSDRVLFGSNGPYVCPATQIEVIRQAELSEADEKKVLRENCAKLFKLC
jgi:predicted TIM-barrel fold metal-dependent hydrolase